MRIGSLFDIRVRKSERGFDVSVHETTAKVQPQRLEGLLDLATLHRALRQLHKKRLEILEVVPLGGQAQ